MKHFIAFLAGICLAQSAIAWQSRVLLEEFEGMSIDIYLPDKYTSKKEYPTIYFNDGQSLFTGFNSLDLKKTLDSLISNKALKPIIVVGIHSDQNRTTTYVPYKDQYINSRSSGFEPKTHEYAEFLTEKLIPHIGSKYSTIKAASGRAIFGFSFGGLNATWTMLNYPDYFSMAGALSPSYWVADYAIFKEADKYRKGQKIWFDIGTAEWNYYVPFQKTLIDKGALYGADIFYYEVPNARHSYPYWKDRVAYPILAFAGIRPFKIKNWRIETEVIPSQSQKGKYYLRLNPIATCTNGAKYSLATTAKYELLNIEDGKVHSDGRFSFKSNKDLEVKVTHEQREKKVKVSYKKVNRLMQ